MLESQRELMAQLEEERGKVRELDSCALKQRRKWTKRRSNGSASYATPEQFIRAFSEREACAHRRMKT
ncbi:hypothetical protein O5699_01175 [Escherichia coli]|nr:hypothetical protein [Escherichia coli]